MGSKRKREATEEGQQYRADLDEKEHKAKRRVTLKSLSKKVDELASLFSGMKTSNAPIPPEIRQEEPVPPGYWYNEGGKKRRSKRKTQRRS